MVEAERNLSEAPPRDGASSPAINQRPLTAAAQRALAEAEERRKAFATSSAPAEQGGRGGLEPVRYGDWEVKGLASDF